MSLTITPPTSSRLNDVQAADRSDVNTPACNPNVESLIEAMASSTSSNFSTTTSGANASFTQTFAVLGAFARIVGGKKVQLRVPPSSTSAPSATASSTHAWVRSALASSTIGP